MSRAESSSRKMRGDSSEQVEKEKAKVAATRERERPDRQVLYQHEKQELRDVVREKPEPKFKIEQQEREQQLKHTDAKLPSSSSLSSSAFQFQHNDNEHENSVEYAPSSSNGVHSDPPDSTPSSLRIRKSPSPPKVDSPPDSSFSDDHASPSHGSSPLHDTTDEPISSIQPDDIPSAHQSPPEIMVRSFKVEPKVVTRVDLGAQEGFVGVGDVEEGSRKFVGGENVNRQLRPEVSKLLKTKRESKLNKFLLGFRISSFVFCMISFSIMAADKKQGWALDSYYVYKEFRYVFAVNILGFAYSALQIYDLVNYFVTRKQIIQNQIKCYLDFCMDQVLTYLLMSASSSAATRAFDWESNWGKDKFPDMANASVGLSFVAFVAFAFSSLISGYHLCRSS